MDVRLRETEIFLEYLGVQSDEFVAGFDHCPAGDHPGDGVETADLGLDFGVVAALKRTLFGDGDQQVTTGDLVSDGRIRNGCRKKSGLQRHHGDDDGNQSEAQDEQCPRSLA